MGDLPAPDKTCRAPVNARARRFASMLPDTPVRARLSTVIAGAGEAVQTIAAEIVWTASPRCSSQ
jgi:hypothetical protein